LCGIAGFTHKNWIPDLGRIRDATATLVHRGPDQQGVFESRFASIGATRLKIIDLQSGDQPLINDDGDSAIVFNGEIYNHEELREELQRRGHRFRTRCDTETVLRAFLEWDAHCFSRLRGMFSLAIWTESDRRLVLARDRMGIKPLYIARGGEDLFFGSELKAILIHPEIERRLSLAGLDCYLSLNYVPCPWTLVDGVEKLPPAHWLEWSDGNIRSEAYWTLPFNTCRDRSSEDAQEELDSLLKNSIREHLISDVPLGVWLSGGIDSSTILHYASAISSKPLKTYSISFRGRSFDESAYIRQVSSRYGTDHAELDLNPGANLADTIEEFAYYSDEPSADAGALPVWFLAKLSKTGTTVSLSGEGADELFGGYLTYRADRLAAQMRRLPPSILRMGLDKMRYWPVSDEKIGFDYKARRFLEGCLLSPERAHIHWNGMFSTAEKRSMLRVPLPGALDSILREIGDLPAAEDDLARYLWFDQKYFLADDILVKSDRMSMAHSVEVRPPFLDHRIVEFAATLPAALKVRGRCQKYILKELMKGKLPKSIPRRKKVGFDIPTHEWLRGPLRTLLMDTISAGVSEHEKLFQPKILETYVSRHLERRANLGYHLWGVMLLFLWMKKWRIRAAGSLTAERVVPERAVIYS
jgi:asparagine synthase (glutamine-hydrolysing)